MNDATTQTQSIVAVAAPQGGGMLTAFRDIEQMFRFSQYIAESPIVPKSFQKNPGSVMIALNMAQRLNMDPLMVMQNIVIVNGNAGLSGKMAIALLNRSPKYRRIEYQFVNGKDYSQGMRVVGHRVDDPEDKRPDVGTAITPQMASAEGWTKNPKWQTMQEQMLRYRAAAFFARAFVPEELLGMQTAEELEDSAVQEGMRDVTPAKKTRASKAEPAPQEPEETHFIPDSESPAASLFKPEKIADKA